MMNTKEELLNILGQNFDKLPLKYDGDLKQLLEESFEKLKTKIKSKRCIIARFVATNFS